jgi:hypothetical protein
MDARQINIYQFDRYLFYIMVKNGRLHLKQFTMEGKLAVSALLAILITTMVTNTIVGPASKVQNAYADNTWYVGKGVQPNTYYTYQLQNGDTDNGQQFLMTLYFKQYNSTGQYWIVPTYVVTHGEVFKGILHLSDLDMSVLGTSQIPDNMSKYASAYSTSLHWLASFVTKATPGSLTGAYWGKIASIGGSPVAPSGSAKVTAPAGTFDTIRVSYHKGVDNNIWIGPNLPFPVKAQTFADVTTGNPPIQYAYELLATGQGSPPPPKSQFEIPKPPLTIQTARGTYFVKLLWEPATIQVGQNTKFGVVFQDNSQNTVSQVSYSIKITEAGGKVVTDLHDQKATDGTGLIPGVKFDKAGPAIVLVTVDAVAGQPMGDFVESASFKVVVAAAGKTAALPGGAASIAPANATPQLPSSSAAGNTTTPSSTAPAGGGGAVAGNQNSSSSNSNPLSKVPILGKLFGG